jgi:hypothetical protein
VRERKKVITADPKLKMGQESGFFANFHFSPIFNHSGLVVAEFSLCIARKQVSLILKIYSIGKIRCQIDSSALEHLKTHGNR